MDLINFPAALAQSGLLNPVDVITSQDLVLVGKRINNLRNGTQYQPHYMRMDEFLAMAPSGGSGNFVKIASGQVNLALVQSNTLAYQPGLTAANTIETDLIITRANNIDVYDANVQPAVKGSCSIEVASGATAARIVSVFLNDVGNTILSTYTTRATDTLAQVISDIISSVQNGWTAVNTSGNIITFYEPNGQEGNFFGFTPSFDANGSGVSVINFTSVTQGTPASTGANYNFKDDVTILKQKSSSNFTNLPNMVNTTQKLISIIDDDTLFSGSGNKSFNVTAATGSQFLINVEVWGIKTS